MAEELASPELTSSLPSDPEILGDPERMVKLLATRKRDILEGIFRGCGHALLSMYTFAQRLEAEDQNASPVGGIGPEVVGESSGTAGQDELEMRRAKSIVLARGRDTAELNIWETGCLKVLTPEEQTSELKLEKIQASMRQLHRTASELPSYSSDAAVAVSEGTRIIREHGPHRIARAIAAEGVPRSVTGEITDEQRKLEQLQHFRQEFQHVKGLLAVVSHIGEHQLLETLLAPQDQLLSEATLNAVKGLQDWYGSEERPSLWDYYARAGKVISELLCIPGELQGRFSAIPDIADNIGELRRMPYAVAKHYLNLETPPESAA